MSARLTHKRSAYLLTVFLVFALIAAACGGGDDSGESQPDADVETTEVVESSEPADSGEDDAADAQDSPDATQEPGEGDGLIAPIIETPTTVASSDGGESAALEPKFGGTLRVTVEAEADSLSPADGSFAVAAYVMALPMFDPLVAYDKDGNWFPYLAESFTPIGDGSVWQMKLREGVRFHDGTELDADDAIATFEAQLADLEISLAVGPVFVAEEDERMAKIDDFTVEFRLSRPMSQFPAALTSQLGMVLPSEWLERAKEDASLNQEPVGQGPFKMERRVQDEVTVLVRNPDYWAADQIDIYLDRIEVYPKTNTEAAAQSLTVGDFDMMITAATEAFLILREDGEVQLIENPFSSEQFAMMNTAAAPFDDLRARQALTFATDRDTYLELIRQGTAIAADTMFHPTLKWHNRNVKQESNMPERAGPLVDSYCADLPDKCSDGKINIELKYSGDSNEATRYAEVIEDSWSDYFNVAIVQVPQDQIIAHVIYGVYQVVLWRHFGAVEPDLDVLWLSCESIRPPHFPQGSLNFPNYCDEDRDTLMYEQRASADLPQRIEIWRQVQEMIRDAYTYIFLSHTNWVIGTGNNVHNVCGQTAPDGTPLFCNDQGRVQLHQVWLS